MIYFLHTYIFEVFFTLLSHTSLIFKYMHTYFLIFFTNKKNFILTIFRHAQFWKRTIINCLGRSSLIFSSFIYKAMQVGSNPLFMDSMMWHFCMSHDISLSFFFSLSFLFCLNTHCSFVAYTLSQLRDFGDMVEHACC